MSDIIKADAQLKFSRKTFIENVLHLAKERGSTVEITDDSGVWSDGFGIRCGENWPSDEEAIFQMCRCFVLTKGIEMAIPE